MRMQHLEIQWSRLGQADDFLEVSCDEDGPAIGPVRLLKRTSLGLEPRPTAELECILGAALEHPIEFAAKVQGLQAAANALETGDLARAMLITQFLWLPSLPDENAFHRAVKADSLAKAGFNPGQPRDDHGRWADEEASEGSSTAAANSNIVPVQDLVLPNSLIPWLEGIRPLRPLAPTPPYPGEILPPAVGTPGIAVPRTLDNPYPEDRGCAEEWENAKKYCRELDDQGKLGVGDYRNHGKIFGQCVRGQVSARCGGSPVDWGAGA